MRSEKGFTLIELLVVVCLLMILSGLGIQTMHTYRSKAAYSVGESTLHSARTALEAGLNNTDNPPPSIELFTQASQGPIANAAAAALLPAMVMPKHVELQASHDADCTEGACMSDMIQAKACQAEEYLRWVRFGDGIDIYMEHQPGGGCAG